jgi:hypothetical protein
MVTTVNRIKLLKTLNITDGTASLYNFNLTDFNYPNCSNMIGLVEFTKRNFRTNNSKKTELVCHNLSLNLTSLDNLAFYRDNIGKNICRVSEDYNSWKIQRIELSLRLHFDPKYLSIELPSPAMFDSKELTAISSKISLAFLDSIMVESVKRGLNVVFCPTLDRCLKIPITGYLDQNSLRLGFDREIRRPYSSCFNPNKNIFNDIFELTGFFPSV